MATVTLSATVGVALPDGKFGSSHNGNNATGDIVVSYDTTKVTKLAQLKSALDAAYFAAKSGHGGLT